MRGIDSWRHQLGYKAPEAPRDVGFLFHLEYLTLAEERSYGIWFGTGWIRIRWLHPGNNEAPSASNSYRSFSLLRQTYNSIPLELLTFSSRVQ